MEYEGYEPAVVATVIEQQLQINAMLIAQVKGLKEEALRSQQEQQILHERINWLHVRILSLEER